MKYEFRNSEIDLKRDFDGLIIHPILFDLKVCMIILNVTSVVSLSHQSPPNKYLELVMKSEMGACYHTRNCMAAS